MLAATLLRASLLLLVLETACAAPSPVRPPIRQIRQVATTSSDSAGTRSADIVHHGAKSSPGTASSTPKGKRRPKDLTWSAKLGLNSLQKGRLQNYAAWRFRGQPVYPRKVVGFIMSLTAKDIREVTTSQRWDTVEEPRANLPPVVQSQLKDIEAELLGEEDAPSPAEAPTLVQEAIVHHYMQQLHDIGASSSLPHYTLAPMHDNIEVTPAIEEGHLNSFADQVIAAARGVAGRATLYNLRRSIKAKLTPSESLVVVRGTAEAKQDLLNKLVPQYVARYKSVSMV